jgi:hypothetical protein
MMKSITYHEAGHAVADIILGVPFDAVSVETKRMSQTHYRDGVPVVMTQRYQDGVSWPKEYSAAVNADLDAGKLDLKLSLAYMAGPQAQAMVVGKMTEEVAYGATLDKWPIIDCCRMALAPKGTTAQQLQTPSVMEGPILDALAKQAEELLKANWDKVAAVADALNERKRLTYAEVKAIVFPSGV